VKSATLQRAWARLVGVLLLPAGLGGAFLGLALFQLGEGGNRIAGLVVGWLYGISVAGLMRLLPVPPGWYWLAGIFAGPIPIALLMSNGTPANERGVILVGALVGLLLGLLESASARRSAGLRTPPAQSPLAPADQGPSS
jgi:hypothetical protein